MTKTVPLIRAANVLPLVRWMEMNQCNAERLLSAADLSYWFALSPLDPVPLLNSIRLLGMLAEAHGPDIGVRIVQEASIPELGFIGGIALGSRSPLEAVQRLQMAMPMHCSHEYFRVVSNDSHVNISDTMLVKAQAADIHALHVMFAAMVLQMCRFTGLYPPLLSRISLMPHPELGTAYLQDSFGCPITAATGTTVTITIDKSVACSPFRRVARERMHQLAAMDVPPLMESQSVAASVRSVVESMLYGGEPTVERVARAAGISVRSLQRQLQAEDTSFTEELNKVRARLALRYAGSAELSLAELTERLGYSAQSSLTRAVRRLTGKTPSQLRHTHTG